MAMRSSPSISPISHSAVTGIAAKSTSDSTTESTPLAKTQSQLGKGRIVNAKTTFDIPSIMKKMISRSDSSSIPCAMLRKSRMPSNTPSMAEMICSQKFGAWRALIRPMA